MSDAEAWHRTLNFQLKPRTLAVKPLTLDLTLDITLGHGIGEEVLVKVGGQSSWLGVRQG